MSGRNSVAELYEAENTRLRARVAELEAAGRDVVTAWVNPADGAPFEDGEVPVLDRLRAALRAEPRTSRRE